MRNSWPQGAGWEWGERGDGEEEGIYAEETAWQRPGGDSKQIAFTEANPDTSGLKADARRCQDHGIVNCQEGMRRWKRVPRLKGRDLGNDSELTTLSGWGSSTATLLPSHTLHVWGRGCG